MRQNMHFNECELDQIKAHLKKEGRGQKWRGEISNQSAINEAVRISNLVIKHLCPDDMNNLGIITLKQES